MQWKALVVAWASVKSWLYFSVILLTLVSCSLSFAFSLLCRMVIKGLPAASGVTCFFIQVFRKKALLSKPSKIFSEVANHRCPGKMSLTLSNLFKSRLIPGGSQLRNKCMVSIQWRMTNISRRLNPNAQT